MITDAARARGHHVHVDAKVLAKHPARITDSTAIVDRETDWHRMDDMAISRLPQEVPLVKHPLQLRIGNFPASNADLGLDDARAEESTGQVRHDLLNRLTCHFLRSVHRVDDGGARRFEIDDRSVAHPVRDLMADTEHPRLIGCDPSNEAADFRSADIKSGD